MKKTVEAVSRHFLRAAHGENIAILAYCFMPDHVHMLVSGETDQSNCKRYIALAKQFSGYWYNAAHRAPLWQKFAWDRVLRSDEDSLSVIRYLLLNPVRAKIATAPMDYPFSGSFVYSRDELMEAFRDWKGDRS